MEKEMPVPEGEAGEGGNAKEAGGEEKESALFLRIKAMKADMRITTDFYKERTFVGLVRNIWANAYARELIFYIFFTAIFTLVAFSSKPGVQQFTLTDIARNWFAPQGPGVPGVAAIPSGDGGVTNWGSLDNKDGFWNYMQQFVPRVIYPQYDNSGTPLDRQTRHYVAAYQGRLIGAMRLRSLRMDPITCPTEEPKWTTVFEAATSMCQTDYSPGSASVATYGGSTAGLQDFTLPFTYQNGTQLGTSASFAEYGYDQGGFNIDLVPNVSPALLSSYVARCKGMLTDSIVACMAQQRVQYDPPSGSPPPPYTAPGFPPPPPSPPSPSPPSPPTNGTFPPPTPPPPKPPPPSPPPPPLPPPFPPPYPPNPPSPPSNASTCVELVAPAVPSKLNLALCRMVPDAYGTCNLTYVSFQQMVPLVLACAGCQCKADQDPTCSASCSALNLYNTQIAALKANNWWDRLTRGVIFDLSIYYPNFNLFQAFRVFFQFPATGGLQPMVIVRTFRLYRYVTFADTVVEGFEIIFLALVVYYSVERILFIRRVGLQAYLSDIWVYIDWANLGLFYALIAVEVNTIVALQAASFSTSNYAAYADMAPVSFYAFQETNLLAVNFVLVYLKFIKYLYYVPRLNMILLTLAVAVFDLVLFSALACMVIFSFGGAFYLCFGKDIPDYSTISLSVGTLSRLLLGADAKYDTLVNVNAVMAPFLYYSFEFVLFFVFLNIFLAILVESFNTTKETEDEEDLNFYINLKNVAFDALGGLFARRAKIKDLASELAKADADGDEMVSMEELQAALSHNPAAMEILKTVSIKELMAKYDISGDGMLNKDELTQVLRDLAEKEAEVNLKIKESTGEKEEGEANGTGPSRPAMPKKPTITSLEHLLAAQTHDGTELKERLQKVETQIKDMSRSVAKKLSLMIDLVMSLSDQVGNQAAAAHAVSGSAVGGGPAAAPPPPVAPPAPAPAALLPPPPRPLLTRPPARPPGA